MITFIKDFVRYFLAFLILRYLLDRFVGSIQRPEFEYIRSAIFAFILSLAKGAYGIYKSKGKTSENSGR